MAVPARCLRGAKEVIKSGRVCSLGDGASESQDLHPSSGAEHRGGLGDQPSDGLASAPNSRPIVITDMLE